MSIRTPPPPELAEPATPVPALDGHVPNPRARMRRILYLAGLAPLVLALAFALKVTLMRDHDGAGTAAFEESDGTTALEEFSANRSLNWLEPWVAHFDTGNASFLLTDYQRAIRLYHDALETVPHEQECSVRINMALAHELLGDGAAEKGDGEGAKVYWEDGIVVLEDGECPTDAGGGEQQTADAAEIRTRLEEKLNPPPPPQQQPQQQPQQPQDPQDPQDEGEQQPQTPEEREQERKRRELEERNDEGAETRREYEELDEYPGSGSDYQW